MRIFYYLLLFYITSLLERLVLRPSFKTWVKLLGPLPSCDPIKFRKTLGPTLNKVAPKGSVTLNLGSTFTT